MVAPAEAADGRAPSRDPQPPQNCAVADSSAPQLGQKRDETAVAPQLSQNFASAGRP